MHGKYGMYYVNKGGLLREKHTQMAGSKYYKHIVVVRREKKYVKTKQRKLAIYSCCCDHAMKTKSTKIDNGIWS